RRLDHRQDLAGAAIAGRGREAGIDAEPLAQLLMEGVAGVGSAHEQPVDVAHREPGIGEGAVGGLLREVEIRKLGHLAEPALAGAGDHVAVGERMRAHFAAALTRPMRARISSLCSPSAGAALRIAVGVSLRLTPPPTSFTSPSLGCGTERTNPRCCTCGSANTSSSW